MRLNNANRLDWFVCVPVLSPLQSMTIGSVAAARIPNTSPVLTNLADCRSVLDPDFVFKMIAAPFSIAQHARLSFLTPRVPV